MTTRLTNVVIDAAHPGNLAHWWSGAIGWPVTYIAPDEVVVEPPGTARAFDVPQLVFVPVDDPKTTKNRIHLDLATDSEAHQARLVERLLGLGATAADVGQGSVPWVVLADPEGNELCVLEPRQRHIGRGPIAAIAVDAVDPVAIAGFWVAAAGWPIGDQQPDIVALHNPRGLLPDLEFVRVDEPKTGKNRIHLDIAPYDGEDHEAEVQRLIGLGATPVDVGQGTATTWVVLADPDGNEFCVLRPRGIPPPADNDQGG